jgi:hypothetical protein
VTFFQSALYILQKEESQAGLIQPGFLQVLQHIALPIAPPLVLPHGEQEASVLIILTHERRESSKLAGSTIRLPPERGRINFVFRQHSVDSLAIDLHQLRNLIDITLMKLQHLHQVSFFGVTGDRRKVLFERRVHSG